MLIPYSLPDEAVSSLGRDYMHSRQAVMQFYRRHYSDNQVFSTTADEVTLSYRGDRALLVQTLLEYNRKLGCSAATVEQINRLADPGALAVLVGQQAGLCGGPLYTVYKAIAAVKLARRLERELSRPVVPVFWVASEDHDFQEVNHMWVLDRANQLQRIELELEHRGEPLGMLPLTDAGPAAVIDRFASLNPESEFSGDILGLLNQTRLLSATPAEWFARIFTTLFADEGLALFDPLLPSIRQMLVPFFREAISRREECRVVLRKRDDALRKAGYPLQVTREPEASLLMLNDGTRRALQWQGDRFATRDGLQSYSADELSELADRSPLLLSPNVLLRPLMQDRLFPTLAFIAGPGELAYFAQLLPLYTVFGMEPPVLVPRPGLTVVEPRFAGYIQRYEIPEEGLLFDLDRNLERVIRQRTGVDMEEVFGRLCRQVRDEYACVKQELSRISHPLGELCEKNLARVCNEITYLRDKAELEAREKNEIVARHFKNMELSFRPLGKLQERVLTYFPFEIKYGPHFWWSLLAEFPDSPGHYLFFYQPGKEN
jgi:bacillithiol biosynthesis cysteine-adding enzyme BshC